MINRFIHYIILVSLGIAILMSCKITQPYRSPAVNTTRLFRDTTTTDTTTIASLRWNEIFTDTILQHLLEEGVAKNLHVKIAATRIRQAQAYFEQSRAAFFPTLSANASASGAKLSEAQSQGRIAQAQQYQLFLNSSWEADIWGRIRSARRANLASLLQSEAYSRTVQTSIVAGIANYYYLLLALDQQLAITRQTVENRIATVETMRALKEGAIVTGAAVVQSEASRYAAEVTIPDLLQNIRETENALSLMLGRPPGAIERGTFDRQSHPEVLQVGIPLQLLSNRPDLQQAEYNFRYTFELTNVARASFYPSLTLTASGGLWSLGVKELFNPGSFYANLAAGLTQPIFNRRANITRLQVATAQQQEALLSFQNTLLTAGQEVSNAISLYRNAVEKLSVRGNQLNALELSVQYSQELLRSGFANYTEVLNAQQNLLTAQLSRSNDLLQQWQAVIDLYRSLGGGWR